MEEREKTEKGGQKEQEVSKGRTGNKLPDFLSAMMEICLDNRKAQFPKETKKTTRSINMKIIFYLTERRNTAKLRQSRCCIRPSNKLYNHTIMTRVGICCLSCKR